MRGASRAVAGGTLGLLAAVAVLGGASVPGSAAHLQVDGGVVQAFTFPGPGADMPTDPDEACGAYQDAVVGLNIDDLLPDLYLQVCLGLDLGLDLDNLGDYLDAIGVIFRQGAVGASPASSATTAPAEVDQRTTPKHRKAPQHRKPSGDDAESQPGTGSTLETGETGDQAGDQAGEATEGDSDQLSDPASPTGDAFPANGTELPQGPNDDERSGPTDDTDDTDATDQSGESGGPTEMPATTAPEDGAALEDEPVADAAGSGAADDNENTGAGA